MASPILCRGISCCHIHQLSSTKPPTVSRAKSAATAQMSLPQDLLGGKAAWHLNLRLAFFGASQFPDSGLASASILFDLLKKVPKALTKGG